MPFQSKNIAMWAGLSIALYVFENLLPNPLIWIRIGLGNIPVIITLYLYGYMYALSVLMLKIFVGGLFSGKLLTIFTVFALSAGLISLLFMWAIKWIKWFSIIFVSMGGAMVHNIVQIFVAFFLVARFKETLYLLPIAIIVGGISGFFTGFISRGIINNLRKEDYV